MEYIITKYALFFKKYKKCENLHIFLINFVKIYTFFGIPLEGYKDDSIFKIYFNDIGLFVTHSKTPLNEIILNTNMLYKGAIAENYVAQTLKTKKYELYYFKIDNKLEVDFLIYKDDGVIPIEVKASDNTRSTSLNNYIKMFNPKYAIRISTKNFGFENNIKSIPLYAAFLI